MVQFSISELYCALPNDLLGSGFASKMLLLADVPMSEMEFIFFVFNDIYLIHSVNGNISSSDFTKICLIREFVFNLNRNLIDYFDYNLSLYE